MGVVTSLCLALIYAAWIGAAYRSWLLPQARILYDVSISQPYQRWGTMKLGGFAKEAFRSSSKGHFRSSAREQAEVAKILATMNARLDVAERLADKTLSELKAMAKNRK